ncbi:SDR family NAD(P)-dependent oxidoreductase [Scandinavium goeteborgense]|uniref:3-oxoacyl-[acyl-carrier protein] reductase n=1 Tax=Scandinavium goeteborgense TaxID=1851514 RepID=A0A4R6EM50_SCAGO|nr:SDR family NAD(P)-dependent oxidoreductase [Scandinavium goeteborgense]TDN60056.1 3-oxoacyl-[acyl-carrier protein] reductase [Scandinavium goeteborgense]
MTQTALVTGAAAGLGNVIATHLLAQGFQVVMTDVDAARVQQAADRIDNGQGKVLALALDIRQPQDFEQALKATIDRFGRLEVLVNNAALTLATPVMEIEVDEFDRVMTTNLRGTFVGCQTLGRYFASRGYGRIINLASLAGQNGGTASGAHYAASKGGILTLTKIFARELSKSGVTVNAIAPGPMDSPAVHAIVPEEKMAGLLQMIPVGTLGDAEFVAQAVALLASPQASFVTGATWDINGGLFMR